MKTLFSLLVLAVTTTSATGLTTQYTSELELYASASAVARLSDEEAHQALLFIASNSSEAEKRAFLRALVK